VQLLLLLSELDCVWNVMAHAQKPDFVFRRNGRVHLNRRGRQFSPLLAAEVCASAVVMLDTPCSEVVWRVLATHSILQFPLHFPSHVSPRAITFQLDSTAWEADSRCAGLSFNPQIHYLIHKISPVVPTRSLTTPRHTVSPQLTIVLPFTARRYLRCL
jgi:hypothetical protein